MEKLSEKLRAEALLMVSESAQAATRYFAQLAEAYEAEWEKRVAALEHACERSMSDFHTLKAYSEEIEGQLRKRIRDLQSQLAEAHEALLTAKRSD
jgi:hypothetical protein